MNLQGNIKLLFLSISINCSAFYGPTQDSEPQFIQTEAKITALDSKISGRTSTVMATVLYVTESGDTLKGRTRLMHVPMIGSFREVGDTVSVLYQKDNPYLVKAREESFWQTYGVYILIALGIVISGYQFVKAKRTN
ncbi:DUF3592 domain-containing protein [Pareuzebyella sediminis]|uniref:DUF3592 domain-containing protein n=1 Tax=Pareuzebyella sediminis TaxID=2607998 RepID=UPI0011EF42F6|nr:DUF3592 domain-containing protein [Pareuzebyella sediminis]